MHLLEFAFDFPLLLECLAQGMIMMLHSTAATTSSKSKAYKDSSSMSDDSHPGPQTLRGREQDSEQRPIGRTDDNSGNENEYNTESIPAQKHRKRKRSRKGLEKTFFCPQEDCGKSYSRAEHLYRHQLNRKYLIVPRVGSQGLMHTVDTPKQLYYCQFPGCERQFVRQDLRTRHRERHTARGLHLHKQEQPAQISDGCSNTPSPLTSLRKQGTVSGINASRSPKESSFSIHALANGAHFAPSIPVRSTISNSLTQPKLDTPLSISVESRSDQDHPGEPGICFDAVPQFHRPNGYEQQFHFHSPATYKSGRSEKNSDAFLGESISPGADVRPYHPHSNLNPAALDGDVTRTNDPVYPRASTYNFSSSTYATQARHANPSQAILSTEKDAGSGISNEDFGPLPPLPRSSLSSIPSTPLAGHRSYNNPGDSLSPVRTNIILEAQDPSEVDPYTTLIDSYGHPSSMPVFGVHGYGLSPTAMAEDFTSWLFSTPQLSNAPPMGPRHGPLSIGQTAFMDGSGNMSFSSEGGVMNGQYVQPVPTQHRMAVNNILDNKVPPTILSDAKWKELLDLIDNRFNEADHSPVSKQKKVIMGGDRNAEDHVLSLSMMTTYIGSYWYHFHPQMPILHQPTFSPDRTKNLLLLVVIAIGASSLDKLHGESATSAGADLSDFLAWHLRDEIFKDVDFLPPAKLWVFQTLILLEIYEKMYSTRVLHERAHIHHGTTLTLMRRGSSLIGRSALDPPPNRADDKLGSASTSNHRGTNNSTPAQWWNHWITNEATRRVAFAAFIIDSIHATMFGHAATMVAHEMKLQLPCDETAWSATSSAEVGRIETNLQAHGIKPITFFDGLRHTLNHKPVRTNPFGRTALMAGLLSVSWHMNQRDVQVRSLGALKALGGKDIWRGTLTKAFDSWRNDFDQSIGKDSEAFYGPHQASAKLNDEIIFESRIVLHHLAHMAMHVDIVSCQIFAKASRLLGRTTLPADYTIAQKRIRENWAPKASARHATFFALKFLSLALLPAIADPRSSSETSEMGEDLEYSARDDFLLNRPWVLYFAALTVWSYGFALDGSVTNVPELNTFEQEKNDMRLFLQRVGGVRCPGDLEHMRDRNCCIGMLLVLQRMFRKCRWELVHEAARLLDNCIKMLKGV